MAWDLAGRTGVAYGRAGETPRATTVDLGKARGEAARLAEVIRATRGLLERMRPEILVYEAPVGGPKTSHFLVAVAGCFVGQATLMGYAPVSVSIGAVRRHFLGKALAARDFPGLSKARAREAIKNAVVARCGALGWKPRTDDEADAMALWDYACATLARGQAAPLGGLFDEKGERSA